MVKKPKKSDECHACKGKGWLKILIGGSMVPVDCPTCGTTGEKPRKKKRK